MPGYVSHLSARPTRVSRRSASLFEAFYRGRVTVVSPLVATESLWGVALSILLIRRTELVGRRVLFGTALIVAGGVLIGIYSG